MTFASFLGKKICFAREMGKNKAENYYKFFLDHGLNELNE